MAYRLLAVDIDGTLVNSRDELTPATREALACVREAGVQIVLATGRRYSRVLPLVAGLGIDLPVVTASGALIKHPADHRTIFRADFGRDRLCRLLEVIARHKYEAVLYGDSYQHGFDFYCPSERSPQLELDDYYLQNAGCGRPWPRLMRDPPDGVFAGFAAGTRDEMLALARELERALPGELYTHVLRSPRYVGYFCEIAPQGVTKWSGVCQLAREWGIAEREICAVGDDVNDLPMIEGAGLGVAMGNAVDEVKRAARRVAPPHDDDGLVEVARWILGGDPPH